MDWAAVEPRAVSILISGMIYRLARRLVVGEQFQRLRLVLAYWGHRLVGIGNVSACGDATVNAEDPPDRGSYARMLDDDLPGQLRIKLPHRFDLQFGPALTAIFEPHKAALQRMHFLNR